LPIWDEHVQWRGETLILQVYIQPRASRDEVIGWHEKGLKIRLKAAPVDGQANKHLIKLLAKAFKVTMQNVRLLRGESSRQKTLSIERPNIMPDWLATIEA